MKKSLRVLAALLLMMILLCSTASASSISEYCLTDRQENFLRVQARVSAANAKVRALVLHAQLTPYDDVDWLLGGCGSAEGDQRSAVRLRPSH